MSDRAPFLDPRVRGLQPSATLAIQEASAARVARGERIFRFGLGQSPFPVPLPVVESLRAHAAEKDYLPVRGLPMLREAVAQFHRSRHGIARTPEDVLVGPGSKELLFLAQLCLDVELLVPSPAWVSYAPQAQVAGRPLRRVPTTFEDRWLPQAHALDRVCTEAGPRPRMLVLNSPSNPVGTALRPDECAALAEACRRHGVLVLSDEIYGEMRYDGSHTSFARYYEEGTIVSSGLSKWCGAGGWRLGTFLFPPQLRWLIEAMGAVASETYSSTSAPIQYAAVRAFRGGPDLERYLRRCRAVLRGLMGWATDRLRAAGARVHEPDAAYYLFPDLSPLRQGLAARGILDDQTLAARLLAETGVALLPGSEFGMEPEALCLRLALVDFDGSRALTAAEDQPVDEAFLSTHMLQTYLAIQAMCGWLTQATASARANGAASLGG